MKRPAKALGRRVQLHRALSKLGLGSRTQAWAWIRRGEVRVDGRVVTDPLTWIDLDCQRIQRGNVESVQATRVAYAVHKPRGLVTTRRDERGRPTLYDLLPAKTPWLFPAGRLDADSEGLIIMTNDSALAERLTAPERHLPKTYQVTVRGQPGTGDLAALRAGVRLSDGWTKPASVRVLRTEPSRSVVEMILTEGRNRQIRRMWASRGFRVSRLQRTAIGTLELGDLEPGACRLLDEAAVVRLLAGPPCH